MRSSILGIALAFSASCALAASPTLDEIVAANYPDQLSKFTAKHHLDDTRQQAHVVVTVSGKEYIAAAYSNGGIGAVALLERTPNGARVDDLIRDHQKGTNPVIHAVDLNGDGHPEIIAIFAGARGSY